MSIELETTYHTNLLDIKPEKDQVKYINSSIMNRNTGNGNAVIKELANLLDKPKNCLYMRNNKVSFLQIKY